MSAADPLIAYITRVAEVPLPTSQQRENFVDYVSHAHSWYKHLSPYPPGTPFFFFINKYAGWDRKHGTPVVQERRQQGLHYAHIPTELYRSAFGCLDYTRDGDRVPLVDERSIGAPTGQTAATSGESTLAYGLPDEILQAGMTLVTGVIHTLSAANFWVWDERGRPDQIQWPQESGGQDTLTGIFARHRESQQSTFVRKEIEVEAGLHKGYPSWERYLWLVDSVLYELLTPERRRQQSEMMRSIDRVCDFIESRRNPPSRTDA